MANSADHLHALFSSWRQRVADSPGANVGALVDPNGQGLKEISAAFAWIHVIEDQLRFLAEKDYKVGVYQRHLQRWMRVPLMLKTGWTGGVSIPDQVVNEDTLDQIEALSSFLDGKVVELTESQELNLRDLIDQADALLTNSTLEPALISYIRRLLAAIRYALDDEAPDHVFDFNSAVENLRVAFQAAAESASTQEEKGSWRSMATQIVVGTSTAFIVEAGKQALGITS